MNSSDTGTGTVNVGNPEEFSIMELARKIVELTGSESEITHKKLPLDDPVKRRPDISLAKKMLEWEPATDLHEGLVKTIQYFKKLLEG